MGEEPGKVLVTGAAGFIGFHVARRLLAAGREVVGADNLNDYYDPALKEARLRELAPFPAFELERIDLADASGTAALFRRHRPGLVIHLAAQAGVRYSLVEPHAYVGANIAGFLNVLEGCRHGGVGHLVYASSSSVYGANTDMPFRTSHKTDRPVSLYGATKKANELMAHSYSHLFGLPTTGLRFFTVYGPWGRPDMAVFKFVKAVVEGRPIDLYNQGRMSRDFTYIDDIVEGLLRVAGTIPQAGDDARMTQGRSGRVGADDGSPPGSAPQDEGERGREERGAPFRVYNIGNDSPVDLGELVATIEREVGREAVLNFLPMQPGDVPASWADIDDLARDTGFRPSTPIGEGIRRFVAWYREFHHATDPSEGARP